jgi:protocatechuate 3,4-dioxygenase beta subunit
LTLSAGQKMTDLVFKMIRAASISGHVYDEDGEPVPDAEVMCYRASRQPGKEQQVWRLERRTNDLGEFQIFALIPGPYYVVVNYQAKLELNFRAPEAVKEIESGYPAMYYPSTTDPSKATAIAVAAGEDVRSIDFVLRPAHFVTVSGRVINTVPAGPHASGSVSLRLHVSGLAEAAQNLY